MRFSRIFRPRSSLWKATATSAVRRSTTSDSVTAEPPPHANYIEALGVPAERLKTVSFGKERPQCTEAI